MSDAEYVSCPRCGMGWSTRKACTACLFRSGGSDPACEVCHGTGDDGLTRAHACPDPLPYEIARSMAQMAEAYGGLVVSQTMRARIKLGLEQGPGA